jgi:hypothetical protein
MYQNTGLIYTPEGAVFAYGSTSSYALFGGQRADLLRRLNSNIPLDEKAAIRQQLGETPYNVTYGTEKEPMRVAEPGKISGAQATVYPEAKTTTTYQPAENGMLIRVEQGSQQAVLLAQPSPTEQDKWSVLPGVQSGVMPATAEGTGWKDTPFYWEAPAPKYEGGPSMLNQAIINRNIEVQSPHPENLVVSDAFRPVVAVQERSQE